jgi:hypothetical protein
LRGRPDVIGKSLVVRSSVGVVALRTGKAQPRLRPIIARQDIMK